MVGRMPFGWWGGLGKIGGGEVTSIQWNVVGPDAVGGGVVGGAESGEGAEVVGEVGLVVVAAGEGEIGPADVGSLMHLLDSLLEALDAAVELGGDANLLVEALGEAAGA